MSNLKPQKLAIYFAYPSGVNSTFSVDGAANVFKDYNQVVFGAGLEETTHPDHQNTVNIINHPLMSKTRVFGYIDSTLDLNVIQDKIDKWAAMSVYGIFLDQFGYDFGLTRAKQRSIIWSVHEKDTKGLKAFVNAWNVDDVFSSDVSTNNPDGLPPNLNANDYYLAESFTIVNGAYDDADTDANGIKDWQNKAAKMNSYKAIYGTKLAAITTTDASDFDPNKFDYAYYGAALNDFDTFGWGEQYFSASSGSLPFHTRKSIPGNRFDSSVLINGNVYERRTNVGIHIDTATHVVSNWLDQ